ncbi:TIM-barrel domain-containing protein [Coprobacter tertius]|uniref:Glycoside hydrolase family 31 protein n=1 Tax=Coprobacter tertius TaxID=2944915 RepID=A0ABT1MKU8_9BACT|nr:glycoside hydrolase family 31 protein [Coprobacter tertius]
MKKNFYFRFFYFFFLCNCLNVFYSYGNSNAKAVAYSERYVRFTVITDGVVRMEWSPSGKFIDDPSFVAVNRDFPVPPYSVNKRGAWVTISTDRMKLKYKKNSGKFSSDNLIITSGKGIKPFTWKPGTVQKGNLKGTSRTLDAYDGTYHIYSRDTLRLEDGLLSTDGWTLIDDSNDFLFDNSDWPWVKKRENKDSQDWYFMAYGNDFKTALKDFTVFAGKVPLPPRYAFGYWWSRYWSYSDKELRQLINNFQTYDIPLDVLVIDIDWHYREPGWGGWTGWTWNRRLFPDPAKFLRYLKDNDLKITLNLHPAEGVASYEENYPQMAEWMGIDKNEGKTIEYLGSDKRFMSGLLNTVLRPMEKNGVDFWWLDWQQWLTDKKIEGLNNTWWINYVFFSDMERNRETRPLLYHRWGGLGNHRYQIGFSGDAIITWKSLAFQPYFTSCASNVLYGYWSHDIGGHMFGYNQEKLDPELFTRWMQYGVLSPIFRTHSGRFAVLKKEIWNFQGDYFEALKNSVDFRYALAPYIYTMARQTYDNGISLCRPMYYDYPDVKEAYTYESEYMFGDQILVAPIVAPMENGLSNVKVWLPSGNDWYEWNTGTMLKGGQTVERAFTITEYPIYVKAGSVLPLYGKVKNLNKNDEAVTVAVFPGKGGEFKMYEDNGNDKHYADEYAFTDLKADRNGCDLTVTIGARKGSYRDMPENRKFMVKIYGSAMPESVIVNGENADYEYSGDELALLVTVPETDCSIEKKVEVHYPASVPELNNGTIGKFNRISKATTALKYRKSDIILTPALGNAESASVALTYYPERFNEIINGFNDTYNRLPELLKEQKLDDETCKWFLETIGWSGK